jgi:WD40 repeat protein
LIHESTPPDYTLISTLPATIASGDGHSSSITSFHLHPSNPLELITASEDGTVKVWSWTDSRLIRTLDIAAALLNTKTKAVDEDTLKERVKVDRMSVGVENGKAFAYLAVNAATRGELHPSNFYSI